MTEDIAVIDVEASGFGRNSYPVEVGVAMPGGETHCMIIKPVSGWHHWDPAAQKLHGIDRNTLVQHGQEVEYVARSLNSWLGGLVVYSDAWGNDSTWLALLFECAEISQHFQIDSLRSLMTEAQAACWHRVKDEVTESSGYRRHRASQDALILQQTFRKTALLTDQRRSRIN